MNVLQGFDPFRWRDLMISNRFLPVPALVALALLSLGLAAPAAATSFVPMTDEALVDQAPAAAVVRILAIEAGAAFSTEYRVEVEQRLKGQLPEAILRVRVIGGGGPNGLSLHIYGAPRFAVGERALLLLQPAGDGAFRPFQLFLGVFHEVSDAGRRFAVRDLARTSEVRVSVDGKVAAGPPQAERPRDFAAFARWIAARGKGSEKPADYRVDSKFTLFTDPGDHLNLRWFVFDAGGHVNWKAFASGQKGVTGGGYAQFQAGLAAWTAEPQTPIDYRYTGLTSSSSALDQVDGVNSIVFNDPKDLIGPFSCSAGGVLAIGGPFFTTSTLAFQGQAFHRIVEADIVVSNGLECFFAHSRNAAKAAEEIFGHELGHTLGLGHSCGDSRSPSCSADPAFDAALMRAFVHDDGRGARLGDDDKAGVRALYAAAAPLAAPGHLAASVVSPTEVRLTWSDESTDETEFRVEVQSPDTGFVDVGAVAGDSTQALIQGLHPATLYSFRVRASHSGVFSQYSNAVGLATDALPGACLASGTALCIRGRFQLSVAWKASSTSFGAGQVMPVGSADSGLFWFTSPDNLELLVKVLDGCSLNQHFWVYTGPATDAQLTLTVIDTQTGKVRVYLNPLGTVAGATTDTEAFATCP
jgi:hypothetical protein